MEEEVTVEAAGADPPTRRLPTCTPFVGVSLGRDSDLQREKPRPRVDPVDLVWIWRPRSENVRIYLAQQLVRHATTPMHSIMRSACTMPNPTISSRFFFSSLLFKQHKESNGESPPQVLDINFHRFFQGYSVILLPFLNICPFKDFK